MKICRTCKIGYKPSSNHLDCPKCRAIARKIACPVCGEQMRPQSSTCFDCKTKLQNRGNWRGGRFESKKGYVYAYCLGHPKKRGTDKYIAEHVLNMERKLGRHLIDGETVHHKNGIKNDNRHENLEIWTGNHPAGCRVEDLLQWAYDFIEQHGDESIRPVREGDRDAGAFPAISTQ